MTDVETLTATLRTFEIASYCIHLQKPAYAIFIHNLNKPVSGRSQEQTGYRNENTDSCPELLEKLIDLLLNCMSPDLFVKQKLISKILIIPDIDASHGKKLDRTDDILVGSTSVSTWMGDHRGRLGAVILGPFVGVDLNR